ncbi:hypothetical protein NIES4106_61290 (plasmid) [Fischerella sp. NIES-4106]|nr:hypothetical protein NIES4106_61290 [Fischerella sp. NIES-4106]
MLINLMSLQHITHILVVYLLSDALFTNLDRRTTKDIVKQIVWRAMEDA